MEPISTAMAAFSVVSAGIKAGKDIASLARPLGKLFDGIEDAKKDHTQKRNGAFSSLSANEEALSTFMAKKQAEDLEKQLREIVVNTRGVSSWHELLKLRVDIKKQRQEEERRLKRELAERNELILVIAATVGIPLIVIVLILYFLIF